LSINVHLTGLLFKNETIFPHGLDEVVQMSGALFPHGLDETLLISGAFL
jgi:hypothetical protein